MPYRTAFSTTPASWPLWSLLLLVTFGPTVVRLHAGEPVQPAAFRLARITDAWQAYADKLTFGKGQTLALVDDGCTLSMPEWSRPAGDRPKVLVSYDSVDGDADPKHEGRGYHGSTIGVPSSLNYNGKWGVAYNDQLAVIRALECCHCNTRDSRTLAAGLQWIIDHHEQYRITTVNLAPVDDLAHDEPVPTEIDAKLTKLRELGIWVSAPAGNHNFTTGISWPACQPDCFAIGAVQPGKDVVHLDRHAKVDLVVPGAATSSSNAIACGAAVVLREAIDKTRYDWKGDGPTLPEAMLAVMQKTGKRVDDPPTQRSYRRLDLRAALDHVFSHAPQGSASTKPPNWVQAAGHVAWRPRDSSGEMVSRDRIWIMGGWFDSYSEPPRDVWSSADGVNWELATGTASWKHSDLPTTLVFDDRMWIMGGWHRGRLPGASASNRVWCSKDGANWTMATDDAGWSPRLGAAGVVFDGKMWILGGVERYYDGTEKSLRNDVWCSADGKQWKQTAAQAPWPARAYHAAVAFDNKLWVFGGGNYVPVYAALNDVWNSSDGVNWTRVTEHAPWAPRIWFSAGVYRSRIWVLGGWSNQPSRNWNDVWHSIDGKNWEQLKTETIWTPRHEHSTYVFRDKLWVTAGNVPPLSNDVWYLELPADWPKMP